MFYRIGEYAYPGLNFIAYSLGFAIICLAFCAVYATYKVWNDRR